MSRTCYSPIALRAPEFGLHLLGKFTESVTVPPLPQYPTSHGMAGIEQSYDGLMLRGTNLDLI